MSEAVKHALKIFKGIEMHPDFEFRDSLTGLISALNIRQGDYHVTNLSEKGLEVEFHPGGERSPTISTQEQSAFDKKKWMEEKKQYTESMLELLGEAIRDTPYRVVARSLLPELKKIEEEFEKRYGPGDPGFIVELKDALELQLPAFDFYSESGEFVASLLGNDFTLKPHHYAEAMHLMEKVGVFAFECKDGELQVGFQPEKRGWLTRMQKWQRELVEWR